MQSSNIYWTKCTVLYSVLHLVFLAVKLLDSTNILSDTQGSHVSAATRNCEQWIMEGVVAVSENKTAKSSLTLWAVLLNYFWTLFYRTVEFGINKILDSQRVKNRYTLQTMAAWVWIGFSNIHNPFLMKKYLPRYFWVRRHIIIERLLFSSCCTTYWRWFFCIIYSVVLTKSQDKKAWKFVQFTEICHHEILFEPWTAAIVCRHGNLC